ncbi:MAG: Na/Pi cotransporter family protein [Cyclobacteriaceae bacterium]|nr:Na/Pi cotransporter family protein [Cyclobacteriaceae bacterium]
MSFIFNFLTIVGSLGLFLLGMKMMSEALQNVAGDRMRSILSSMTSNRFTGVLTGLLITAIIQSSSATTVMVVSFVNAGLLPLAKSVGVILGANIGTTVTAWLITLFGFKVKISLLSLPLIGLAFPLMFSKSKYKAWAEVLIGFAILFIGLDFMKSNVPNIENNPQVLDFIRSFNDFGFASVLIFILIGCILTMIIQSSSAVVALTIVMCYQGWLGFELAAAMVLGDNIGTTITANISAIVANRIAKQAAIVHLIFNVFGVALFLPFLFPLLHFINSISVSLGNISAYEAAEGVPVALSIFHSFFNILNTSIFIWFVPQLVRIAETILPVKSDEDEVFHLQYIKFGMLSTSELSLVQAKKEVIIFGEKVEKMVGFVHDLFSNQKDKKSGKLIKKIIKYEEITDRFEIEISEYLKKVSRNKLSTKTSAEVHSILRIIDNLESIGDICYQISQFHERRIDDKLKISIKLDLNLQSILQLVLDSISQMNENLKKNYSQINLDIAHEIEKKINDMRDTLRRENLEAIRDGKYDFSKANYYKGIFNRTERIGDYVYDVSYAMANV